MTYVESTWEESERLMKRKPGFVALLALTLLSACVSKPSYFMFKDVPQDEVRRDDANCKLQSESIQMADFEYRGTFMEGANIQAKKNKAWELCMVGKGYVQRPLGD